MELKPVCVGDIASGVIKLDFNSLTSYLSILIYNEMFCILVMIDDWGQNGTQCYHRGEMAQGDFDVG